MRKALMLAGVGLVLARPASAQDVATIQTLNDSLSTAFNRGDIAAFAGMYTEDADLLPPGTGIMKGRSAVQAFWTKAAEGIGDAKLTTVDVLPLGPEAARAIGTFRLRTKGAQPQEVAGKYVVVWRKIDAAGSSRPTSGTVTSSAARRPYAGTNQRVIW
jgi:uncharacterized protein (TIGR02246 family)